MDSPIDVGQPLPHPYVSAQIDANLEHDEVWPQTMPVSSELFVETVRALQGVGDCYFAGDYRGCPSMEVAVTTGLDVAQWVYKNHRPTKFGH